MPPLENPAHEKFCQEYVRHGNGSRAVVAAGYKAKTWEESGSSSAGVQANYLLKNQKIQFRVQELQEQRARRADVSHIYVLTKLKTVVRRSLQEVRPIIDPVTKLPTGEYEYDSKGAVSALKLIGQHLKMFDEKPVPQGNVTNNTQVNIYLPEKYGHTRIGGTCEESQDGAIAGRTIESNGHAVSLPTKS